jgi:uncharacterized membrane protein HdeD (DUF308 family)
MTTSTYPVSTRKGASSVILSVALIIMGILGMVLPEIPSIAVVLIVGWLLLFDGFIQLAHAFQSKGIGPIAWKLLVSLCYIASGIFLLARPLIGAASLTLMLAVFFFVIGVMDIVFYFSTRAAGRSGWMLLNGLVTLILGFIIWRRWPQGALWYLGTLVGVGMFMTGVTRLMMTLTARRLLSESHGIPTETPRAA